MSNCITLEPGATPNYNEISVANFLIKNKFTRRVHFLKASVIKDVHTPDALINGIRWEMKNPVGTSSGTIKRAFKNALCQSENLIFDLRGSKLPDQANVSRLKKEFYDIKKAKRLLIITKTKRLLEFYK